jgi:metal-responsive CopG/Arc/MetJ family transcriptional regulator
MSKTSSAVKYRYNTKHYTLIGANLDKELVEEFRRALAERGDTVAEIFRNAIKAYLAANSGGTGPEN